MVITARLQKRPQLRAVVTKPQSGGGYSEGYEAGKEAGYQDGYKAGHTDGYNTGHSMGYAEGWDAGYARGYDEGYAKGKADVEAQNEAILSDINTVLVEKGAERAESLTDVPEKIGSIQAGGGDSYHDIFWDSFQRNGAETDYQYKFRGAGWTDANFKPKYDIVPEGNATSIFESSGITDVKGILEALGITLDFSKVTYANNPYSGSAITRLPVLDLSNIENLSSHFNSASKLVWIDEVVLSESGNHNFGSGTGYNWTLYSNIKSRWME